MTESLTGRLALGDIIAGVPSTHCWCYPRCDCYENYLMDLEQEYPDYCEPPERAEFAGCRCATACQCKPYQPPEPEPLVRHGTIDRLTGAGLTADQIGEEVWRMVQECFPDDVPPHLALALAPFEDGSYDLDALRRVLMSPPLGWVPDYLDHRLRRLVCTPSDLDDKCFAISHPLCGSEADVDHFLREMCEYPPTREALVCLVDPDDDDFRSRYWLIPAGTRVDFDGNICYAAEGGLLLEEYRGLLEAAAHHVYRESAGLVAPTRYFPPPRLPDEDYM